MKTLNSNIAEVRLVYKTKVKASDRQQIKCSKDAYDIFKGSWDQVIWARNLAQTAARGVASPDEARILLGLQAP